MRNIFAALFLLGASCPASAQHLAHSDILLFSLAKSADNTWQPAAPRYLTAFNPKGYNNQPVFFQQ